MTAPKIPVAINIHVKYIDGTQQEFQIDPALHGGVVSDDGLRYSEESHYRDDNYLDLIDHSLYKVTHRLEWDELVPAPLPYTRQPRPLPAEAPEVAPIKDNRRGHKFWRLPRR